MGVEERETWRNPGPARVVLQRLDRRGDTVKELVGPNKTVQLTETERVLNQERAYDPSMDVFSNGTLVPVRLIEGSDIAKACASNPNLITDGDMRSMVGVPTRSAEVQEAFAERVASIGNVTTLQRLLTLALEEDAPHSRVAAIEARIAEIEAPAGPAKAAAVSAGLPGAPSSPDAPGGDRMPTTERPVTPR